MKTLILAALMLLSCIANSQDILPQTFGVMGNGKPVDKVNLKTWLDYCKQTGKRVYFPEGKYCLPTDFQYDFGDTDAVIEGVHGKTVITTYDTSNVATNFEIPLRVDLATKPNDGIYMDDATDQYIQIRKGVQLPMTFSQVKLLGYVTELNTNLPDNNPDGIYVVSNHPQYEYGGGFVHINLKGGTYNTGGLNVWYTQGTVLKKDGGIWSRHCTGAGFICRANMTIRDISFNNVQFYLFSPFDVNQKIYTSTDGMLIEGCDFKNVARVLSSMCYGGVDLAFNWYNTLQVYNAWGLLRFRNFTIRNNTFSSIHTSIVWGVPPSQTIMIENNSVRDCYTSITCFNLFITNYYDKSYFIDRISQVITGNSFVNVRPLYNNFTTSIIRTSGLATVNNNQFVDCTQQIFLSGGNCTFNGNFVQKYNDACPTQSPVILIKTTNSVTTLISGNTVVSPMGGFVSLEGTSNTIIANNNLSLCTHFRFITSTSDRMLQNRIYNISDVNKFKTLAVTYDTSTTVNPGNFVYYNKRKKIWQKITGVPSTYVYSKADEAMDPNQFVRITDNSVESECITNIGSGVATKAFKSVVITNNEILHAVTMCSGNVPVEDFTFSNNYLRVALSGPTSTQAKNIYMDNNKISTTRF